MSEREEQGGDPEVGTCHMCGKVFSTQEDLAQHLRQAHQGKGLTEEGP